MDLGMRKVLNQLLAPCHSHVQSPHSSKRGLAPRSSGISCQVHLTGSSLRRCGAPLGAGGNCHWLPAARGAGEGTDADYISQDANRKPRVEETSTVLSLGFSAASQGAEKVRDGDNQLPSCAGQFFQPNSLELRLFCFIPFLRVSCL